MHHFSSGVVVLFLRVVVSCCWGLSTVVWGFSSCCPVFSIREAYRTEVAKTEEDARKLIEQGFEYVCTLGETMIFKRPKFEG